MNDVLKKEELEPRDIVGWREDGLIVYAFNVDRPDQFVRLYTPEQAEQIASSLNLCAKQLKEYIARGVT